MKIGFDLDGIFINKPPFIPKEVIERLYKSDGKRINYRIPSLFEQYIRKLSHYYLFRPAIKKNILFVSYHRKRNTHRYYLISGRFGFIQKETKIIMERYKLDRLFHEKFFNYNNNQPHVFKHKMLHKLQIDMFIDDDLDLLKFLSKKNPQKKFFWLNKKQRHKIQKNLISITNLSQMFNK